MNPSMVRPPILLDRVLPIRWRPSCLLYTSCANQAAARYAKREKVPFVYRVHEQPDPERIEALKRVADVMGFQTRKLKPGVQTKDLANLLDASAHTPFCHVISHQIIRAMAKARYDPNPLGHYGLSLEDYCHFTSPIRRYPDLMVHRKMCIRDSGSPPLFP